MQGASPALALCGDFRAVPGNNETAVSFADTAAGATELIERCHYCGSDGRGSLIGCVVWAPPNATYRLLLKEIITVRVA